MAKFAGLPKTIISRAAKILEKLESKRSDNKLSEDDISSEQLNIFNATNHIIIQILEKIDIDNITPVEAINELNKLKKLID